MQLQCLTAVRCCTIQLIFSFPCNCRSYLLRSASTDSHAVAVFKPKDEEPLAVNNPKPCLWGESNGDSCKVGILPGEGAEREVIAYILDHEHLAGVPATAMVACQEQVSWPWLLVCEESLFTDQVNNFWSPPSQTPSLPLSSDFCSELSAAQIACYRMPE